MDYVEFIKQTVLKFDDDVFEDFKDVINDEFRLAKIIDSKTFSQQVFCEKLCDYFEMVAIKEKKDKVLDNKVFEKIKKKENESSIFEKTTKEYLKHIDEFVKPRIKFSEETSKNLFTKNSKKNSEKNSEKTRTEKYYVRANSYKKNINDNIEKKEYEKLLNNLETYTRVMICICNSSIKNGNQKISDFDFSVSSINIKNVIINFRTWNQKKLMSPKWHEHYSIDKAVFLLLIILLYKIINDQVKGEFFDA